MARKSKEVQKYEPPKPRKRPGKYKKSMSKSQKRSFKKSVGQGKPR